MTVSTVQCETYEFEAFRKMTDEDRRILQPLKTTEDDLQYFRKNYHDAEIPKEIEAKIAYAEANKMFSEMRIWHSPTRSGPGDILSRQNAGKLLFLVGSVKGPAEYLGTLYLIGRWGEILPSWDEMRIMATETHRNRINKLLREIREMIDSNLDAIESESSEDILSRTVPYCYGLR